MNTYNYESMNQTLELGSVSYLLSGIALVIISIMGNFLSQIMGFCDEFTLVLVLYYSERISGVVQVQWGCNLS